MEFDHIPLYAEMTEENEEMSDRNNMSEGAAEEDKKKAGIYILSTWRGNNSLISRKEKKIQCGGGGE